MGPEACQAGEHILVLGQLDLCLGVGGLGAHGEDVEDERRAVEYLYLELCLDVPYLLGGELVVEDCHADFPFLLGFGFDIRPQLLQLAFTDVGGRERRVEALDETLDDHRPCRVGEELQFIEVLISLHFVLVACDEAYEDCGLGLRLGDYKFFHYRRFFSFLFKIWCHLAPPCPLPRMMEQR